MICQACEWGMGMQWNPHAHRYSGPAPAWLAMRLKKFLNFDVLMAKMEEMIRAFPGQLRFALEPVSGLAPLRKPVNHIAVIGMGGSAFGAEVVKNLIASSCPVPFTIFRDYQLPAWVGPETLIIASSYSGDTEETLIALQSVLSRQPMVLCITSGGKLTELAQSEGFGLLPVPGGLPPRKAAGYSIARQLQALQHYGLCADLRSEVQEAISLLEAFSDHDLVNDIAAQIHGRLPIVYASAQAGSVALRWRQEIEENAKHLASHAEVPEMNHNELVGWQFPVPVLSNCTAIFLETSHDHERVAVRMKLNREMVQPHAGAVVNVNAKGHSFAAQLLWLLHLGDWVSLRLATLNEVDPLPVEAITYLKEELGKRG